MLWSEVVVLATVVVLFGAGFAVSLRRGAAVVETAHIERQQVLAALGLLAAGAAFWLSISRNTEVDMPWTWSLSILLGLLAVLVAARPRAGGRGVLLSAVAAPVIAVVGMALIYALGTGVSDGAGGTEPFATMAMVSVMGSAAAYTGPALATAALLRPGVPKDAGAPPGWYADPASPGSERYWDGSAWTKQMRPVDERANSTSSG
jgi:cytochrome bd-type quinol oxidase subunit 2